MLYNYILAGVELDPHLLFVLVFVCFYYLLIYS